MTSPSVLSASVDLPEIATPISDFLRVASRFKSAPWRHFLGSGVTADAEAVHFGSARDAIGCARRFRRVIHVCRPGTSDQQQIATSIGRLGLANVEFLEAHGDERLPLADDRFRIGVVHDLDWVVAEYGRLGGCYRDGAALLAEVARVTSPGGTIIVNLRAVESRSLGATMQRRRLVAVGTQTLRRAGFKNIRAIRYDAALDGDELYSAELVALEPNLRERFHQWLTILSGRPTGLIASGANGDAAHTRIDTLLDRIEVPGTTRPTSSARTIHFGSGGVFRIHTTDFIVRLPVDETIAARCRRNYETLEALARGPALPFAVPRPITTGQHEGSSYFVESCVPGRSLDYQRARASARAVFREQALAALVAMQRATRKVVPHGEQAFETRFVTPVRRLAPYLRPASAAHIERCLTLVRPTVVSSMVPAVFQHGDFKITNLLWDDQHSAPRLAGVIDWDLGEQAGLPVIDAVIYDAFDGSLESGATIASGIARALGSTASDDPYRRFCAEELGLGPVHIAACVLMGFVHFAINNHAVINDDLFKQWCAAELAGPIEMLTAGVEATVNGSTGTCGLHQ